MRQNIKFYDTSALLEGLEDVFKEEFVISSITLKELENIKTSAHKDAHQKYQVRKLLQLLINNQDKYFVWIYNNEMLAPIEEKNLPITNDMYILATALDYEKKCRPDEVIFTTKDIAQYNLANLFFGQDSIEYYIKPEPVSYDGYVEIVMDDEELAELYTSHKNIYNIPINGYLIIKNTNNEIVDQLCWTGDTFRPVGYTDIKSMQFGKIKAYKDDVYQILALDSLAHNKITMLKGPAGTGKSTLSLGFLFSQLERGKIDKIVVFCNTVATKDSAKLGYYPGSRDEKLLDSQIGNFLASKLGDITAVQKLVQEGTLILLPTADIRGYDTTNMRAGVYITEAQNMSVQLMKLCLQRIGEDSICILDGDMEAQVDLPEFEGYNNGMKRASEVFRGKSVYGEINLKTIHRSQIASIAQNM